MSRMLSIHLFRSLEYARICQNNLRNSKSVLVHSNHMSSNHHDSWPHLWIHRQEPLDQVSSLPGDQAPGGAVTDLTHLLPMLLWAQTSNHKGHPTTPADRWWCCFYFQENGRCQTRDIETQMAHRNTFWKNCFCEPWCSAFIWDSQQHRIENHAETPIVHPLVVFPLEDLHKVTAHGPMATASQPLEPRSLAYQPRHI